MILSTFSCSCWPSVYLIWKNVYSGSLHIFSLDCMFCYCLFSHFWMSVSIAIIWSLYCHCVSGSCMCLRWGSIRMADICVFQKRSPSSGCSDSPSAMGSDVIWRKITCGYQCHQQVKSGEIREFPFQISSNSNHLLITNIYCPSVSVIRNTAQAVQKSPFPVPSFLPQVKEWMIKLLLVSYIFHFYQYCYRQDFYCILSI